MKDLCVSLCSRCSVFRRTLARTPSLFLAVDGDAFGLHESEAYGQLFAFDAAQQLDAFAF